MTGEAKAQLKEARESVAREFKDSYDPKLHAHEPSYKAPGRLGAPKLELEDDPRTNTKLGEFLKQIGLGKHAPLPRQLEVNENSSIDEIAQLVGESEAGFTLLYEDKANPITIPEDANEPKVEKIEETIKGGNGQDMKVYIYRPADQSGPLPGVVYTHGGGMVILRTELPVHDRWSRSIAAQGCVVVMPDFRNGWTKEVYSHFPKPLNDCVAAVKWVVANREKLHMRNVVLQGESGGANLAFAISLTAKREGWIKEIAGVYGSVPYISNAYGWTEERLLKELPSLVENNGLFLERQSSAYLAYFYTPEDKDQTNPLAWPYHATLDDLKGLPPHTLVMDELDIFRDEGVSYYRRLVQAGVEARGSIQLGVVHATSLIFRGPVREYNKSMVRDIASFARERE